MKLTGSEAIFRSLIEEGVDTIFGYPGGAIMPVYDALVGFQDQIRHVLVRHEQGAAHAAEGYANATGKVGVCIATSGPGATNLVTGIADAMMDSIPIVCITGQVFRHLLGTDAFQETDVIGVTMPVTKWNYQITKAEEIPEILAKAFYIAKTGRPGPVVIDITKNAQVDEFDFEYKRVESIEGFSPQIDADPQAITSAAEIIDKAEKPFLLLGHGVSISGAEKELRAFVEKTGIPAASTLLGLSSFPSGHPLYVGMLGMHGNYGPNLLSNEADVIIAVGMRFDDRVTGNLAEYIQNARVIHIEIDPAEIGKNVRTEIGIQADAKLALQALIEAVQPRTHDEWLAKFRSCDETENEKIIQHELHPKEGELKMGEVVRTISNVTSGNAIVLADVGQHQMLTARYYQFQQSRSFFTSGGLGTMGYALPAAVGAKLGAPMRDVIAVIGDGGFQMNCQELGTIAQEKLPVKVVILNNNYLGMVRQWQELFFDNRYSFVHLQNPDFIKLCEAFGIPAARVSKREDLEGAVQKMVSADGPYLLEVKVEKEENVFPMVPTGAAVHEIRLA